jgi:hypothetical protein
MLKFINKKGKQVMEMKDNGEIRIQDVKLQKELELQEGVVKKESEQEEEE